MVTRKDAATRASSLSVRAEISILPVAHKGSPNQPGYRVRLDGIEVGAGWHRTDLASRKEYVSLSPSRGRGGSKPISHGPEVKARPDVFALIWNLRLERCLASKGVPARNRSARSCSAAGSRASVGTPGNRRTPQRQMTRTDKTAALFGPSFREYSSLR